VPHMRESQKRHRRETWWRITVPTLLVVLLIGALVALVIVLPLRAQKSLVSDTMLTVLMLCPAAICLLPLTLLAVIAVFGMNQVHDKLAEALRRVEDYSELMVKKTEQGTDVINRRTIDVAARLAPVHRLLGFFEDEGKDESTR
jgi:high-affinity K+ transport system ATPase subunit B